MPRPIRFFIPGHVWHLTHRCHNREFMLNYAYYRKLWMKWLYEGTNRYDVPILNFMVTSNHIHLLVLAPKDMEAIPRLMQLVAGRTGQEFNQRRNRKGAYWEKRYSATAVQTGEHLVRCLLYIDLNMTRAGVVKHPRDWEHCGYHEIKKEKSKYRTVAREKLCNLIEIELDELPKTYDSWVKQMLKQGNLSRDSIWSADFAVGDETFVRSVFKFLGFPTRDPLQAKAVNEEMAPYGETMWNELEWEIF